MEHEEPGRGAQAGAPGCGGGTAAGGCAQRPKSPYPKTHNPLYEQLARAELRRILNDKSAPIHALVDERALQEGLLVQAGDYGRPWFGQLMAGPQMIAWLIQLNAWMESFHFCYPGA